MVNTERLCMGCMNDNGGEKVCPICGYDSSEDNKKEHLAVGTWLNANRYLLGRVIEESGDGVTYIGWDNDSNAVVNIKEYFPEGIAVRSTDRMTVAPVYSKELSFNRGLESFIALSSDLERLPESTAILRVVDGFESNGTAYSVAATVSGTTLKAFLIKNGGVLKWEQVKPLFMPLLATISQLNEAGIVHRGISPDNIIVGRDGKLRLTGFCIKEARVEHTEFLSGLATGYAAPEQYLENDTFGESCDVYAIGAVIFRCIIGVTPPDAKDRLSNDRLSIPAKVAESVPRGVLVAMANTLKVDKSQRTPSVERFYSALEAIISDTVIVSGSKANENEQKPKKRTGAKYALIATLATVLVFVIAIVSVKIFAPELFGEEETVDINNPTASDVASGYEEEETSGIQQGKPKFEIPDLKGQSFNEAQIKLQTDGYFDIKVTGTTYSKTVKRGHICAQSIAAGTKMARGTEITVTISLGPEEINMPNLKKMNVKDAKIKLLEMGFFGTNIIERKKSTDEVKPGCVCETSIKAGTEVSINATIILYYAGEPDPEEEEEEDSSGNNNHSSNNNNSNNSNNSNNNSSSKNSSSTTSSTDTSTSSGSNTSTSSGSETDSSSDSSADSSSDTDTDGSSESSSDSSSSTNESSSDVSSTGSSEINE